MVLVDREQGLAEDFFDRKIDRQVSGLRLRNYPEPEPAAPPRPGQLRVGPHSDFGGVTILKPEADVAGGLQVQDIGNDEGAEQGKWTDVPFVDGGYVLNLGKVNSPINHPSEFKPFISPFTHHSPFM